MVDVSTLVLCSVVPLVGPNQADDSLKRAVLSCFPLDFLDCHGIRKRLLSSRSHSALPCVAHACAGSPVMLDANFYLYCKGGQNKLSCSCSCGGGSNGRAATPNREQEDDITE